MDATLLRMMLEDGVSARVYTKLLELHGTTGTLGHMLFLCEHGWDAYDECEFYLPQEGE